jgi:hypothetical protein
MLVLGCGFGPSSSAFMVAVQSAVSWELRGVVTSTTQLFRSLGGTVGVALLGALLNAWVQTIIPDGAAEQAGLLDPATRQSMSPESLAELQQALMAGLEPVFIALLALAVLGLVVALRYAKDTPLDGQFSRRPAAPRASRSTVIDKQGAISQASA